MKDYNCKRCSDTGYILLRDAGQIGFCACPSGIARAESASAEKSSRSIAFSVTRKPFVKSLAPSDYETIRRFIYSTISGDHASGRPFLFIFGPIGSGKTSILRESYWEIIGGGKLVYGIQANDLKFSIASSHPSRIKEVIQTYQEVPAFLLDDLDLLITGNQKALAVVDAIIDTRFEMRLPTLVTSSQDVHDIATISPRLASRLSDRQVVAHVNLPQKDHRLEMLTPLQVVQAA